MIFVRLLVAEISKKYVVNSNPKFSLFGKILTVGFSAIRHIKPNMTESNNVKYVNGIIKSSEDKRCYRGLELENKLKILLISDSDTEKAAVALSVRVGSLSDPVEVPGLAHFCEHMLFLGTEKYPVENDYSKYISEHGGMCNASTASDHTTYYFDVLPEHIEGALDRFAQFFLHPLFNEDAAEREIQAVNSEFEKNVPSDDWRCIQIEKHLSKKTHPFSKFSIGNLQTLGITPKENGIDIRNELLKFHNEWYSANLMTLVVLGKDSLDDLEKLCKSLFENVKNNNVPQPEWVEHPFGAEHLQIKVYIVPIKDIRGIKLSFPAPDYCEHYKSNPFHYVSHLIGHEGPGSLLSALKARGWCNKLSSGYENSIRGFAFYTINADLTDEGMDHIDDITTLIFQYINMLKEEEPHKWIFEELQQLGRTKFRFKEKENPMSYTGGLAQLSQYYPMEELLCGPYFIEEWRPDLIKLVLSHLEPKFCRVVLMAQVYEKIANENEPWSGTKYKVEKIAPSTIQKWENCGLHEDLKMPKPNEFISTNFKIFPQDDEASSPHPVIIVENPTSRVWFKQDDEFLLPKANLKFHFVSPLANLDPLNCSLTSMFVQVLKDSLNEYYYDASLAGLKWGVGNTDDGLMIFVSGYNEKQVVLLDKILERMTNFDIDPKRFKCLKENYVRTLKNLEAQQPYSQATQYLSILLQEHAWTKDELLESTEYLTVERLADFIPQLLAKLHVEYLIHGNVDKEGAKKIIDTVDYRLKCKSSLLPVLPKQLLKIREIQLVDGANFKYEGSNQFFNSSCTDTYYQCNVLSTKNNMLLNLLVQIIKDPCFNILRTKEQLGYIVASVIRRSFCAQGLQIIVQSNRHPTYVDQRIEAFLIQFRKMVEEMSETEFESHKNSLATLILEKPKKLSILSAKFWSEIVSQQYHFNRAEVEAAYLKTITKEELLAFFDEYIKYGAVHRRKLSVHILAKGEGGAGNKPEPDAEALALSEKGLPPSPPFIPPSKIEDITKFKSSHGLFPLAQPYIDITSSATKSKL